MRFVITTLKYKRHLSLEASYFFIKLTLIGNIYIITGSETSKTSLINTHKNIQNDLSSQQQEFHKAI